jgi:hypothetical protein
MSKNLVEKKKKEKRAKKECEEIGISKHLKIFVWGPFCHTPNQSSSGQKSLHFQFACQLGLEKFGHPNT